MGPTRTDVPKEGHRHPAMPHPATRRSHSPPRAVATSAPQWKATSALVNTRVAFGNSPGNTFPRGSPATRSRSVTHVIPAIIAAVTRVFQAIIAEESGSFAAGTGVWESGIPVVGAGYRQSDGSADEATDKKGDWWR